jgi:hypothetical protein
MPDMFGPGLGELALDQSHLNAPNKEIGKESVEKMVAKGQEYLSEMTKSLKDYFFGPIKGADQMAYLRMVSRYASSGVATEAATVRLTLMKQQPRKRPIAFDGVSLEEKGVENDTE